MKTVGELKEFIKNLPDDMPLVNYQSSMERSGYQNNVFCSVVIEINNATINNSSLGFKFCMLCLKTIVLDLLLGFWIKFLKIICYLGECKEKRHHIECDAFAYTSYLKFLVTLHHYPMYTPPPSTYWPVCQSL